MQVSLLFQPSSYSALAAMNMGMSRVAVFPEREEILICSPRFISVTPQGVGAGPIGPVPRAESSSSETLSFSGTLPPPVVPVWP
jgi:hypothetical protein